MITHLPMDIASTQYRPLSGHMLIDYERSTETDGGILTPEMNDWYAKVLAVCDGSDVLVGERIFVDEFRGVNLTFVDGTYTIIKRSDVLAVLDKEQDD